MTPHSPNRLPQLGALVLSDVTSARAGSTPATVLVVVTRRIGDVLLATPVFRSLKRAWPQTRIDALVFAGSVGGGFVFPEFLPAYDGVASLCNLVNPERIVVGGSIGAAGEVLLEPLRDSVRRRAIPSAAQDVEIVSASLGERAELLGAVALVFQGAGSAAVPVQSSLVP